jgi:diguanylate cyclase (GGDEF)-like protein
MRREGSDPRLERFRRAAEEMVHGHFRVDLPTDARDEVGRLGRSLVDLGLALEQRFRELGRLNELTERLHSAVLLDEALDYLFESLRPSIPYDRMGCSLVRGGGDEPLTVEAVWARSDSPRVRIGPGYRAPLAGSSLQQILESGQPRVIDDLERYGREHPDSLSTPLMLEEGVRSSLTCPLLSMGRPTGFLFFSSFRARTYEEAHVDLFRFIAGHVSTLVEKSALYQQLLETRRELETANQRLAQLASVDGLTGIANRRSFDRQLDVVWRLAQREGWPVALLMVDIDGFKLINDRLGHLQGDERLRRIAEILAHGLLRSSDFAARYGGDEFAILLPATDRTGAEAVARRLCNSVALAAGEAERRLLEGTVSIGGATLSPVPEDSAAALVAAADEALYLAKTAGRNRWIVHAVPSAAARVGPAASP